MKLLRNLTVLLLCGKLASLELCSKPRYPDHHYCVFKVDAVLYAICTFRV